MNICVIGLGLLGGSYALGLKSVRKDIKITGVDNNPYHSSKALTLGIVDEILEFPEAVKISDLVVLATPVDVMIPQIRLILDLLREDAVVTDLGSTKELICLEADKHPRRNRYVAAHPIAGTENSGPDSAFESLLKHKMLIICDKEKSDKEALDLVEGLFKSLDMKITHMSSREHDRHIAYVSHLSHISSFALGATVLDKEKDERSIFHMAGSGFSSTVRLAKSSPDMWTPIFSQNRKNVLDALDAYINKLQYFKKLIEEDDRENSYHLMKTTNEIRRILQGISKSEQE